MEVLEGTRYTGSLPVREYLRPKVAGGDQVWAYTRDTDGLFFAMAVTVEEVDRLSVVGEA